MISLGVGAAERHALLVGNGKYSHLDPLPNPPNDVTLVRDALTKVGFKVTMLVDADRRSMDQAAKAFATQLDDAGKNAVGVFYYAGHGVTYEGENWLLPVTANIEQGADIEYESISAGKVLTLMEGARNATDIMILDACRNSPFKNFSLSGTRAVTVGMKRMDAPVGSFIAYSTAPGMVAYDGAGEYSPFAEAFAAEIPVPGHSIGDMMIEVRKRVKTATTRLGSRPQTPWDASSLTGRFAFNPGRAPATVPAVQPTEAPQQAPPMTAEMRLWQQIQNANDPAEFELYLNRYPQGQYADLAKIRMNRLQKRQPSPGSGQGDQPFAADTPAQDEVAAEVANLCGQYAGVGTADYRECVAEMTEEMAEEFASENGMFGDESYREPMQSPSLQNPSLQTPSMQMPSMQMPQQQVWWDDEYNQWTVVQQGNQFAASSFAVGVGQITLQGQISGAEISFRIYAADGSQVGYGSGTVQDPTHILAVSYWNNGVPLGNTRFHIGHQPQ
ncbi:MAG: caspase family protein [Pseudomonadota bacterium]